MKEGSVIQVAYVVRDIEAAMKRHWDVCGVGPWSVYEFNPQKVRDYTYRGKPATHSCLIAVTPLGEGAQAELMQPLTGRSIYDEHLETKGEGLHHVKLFHADCAAAVERYKKAGYPVIQSGWFDNDVHYYFDTEKDFGYIVEIGNCGKIRDAERRYPV
jgi:methylmalonyl-CoA/ethylmalonyl-CoA epimerase